MRKIYSLLFALVLFGTTNINAQFAVTTNSGSGLAPTYTSLANAITALNLATITSPVVITCPTGAETAIAGGLSITASGTAVNTITIQGNGAANSIITASNAQVAGSRLDAVIKIVGGDFITITGFRLQENAANLTTALATNNMTELGVGVFYTTATNGAQNNVISNNSIALGATYQNTIGVYATSGHTATSATVSANATSNAGLNSGLKVQGNTISSVAFGVYVVSVPNTAAITETGIEIGGSTAPLGNTITYGFNTAFDGGYVNFSTASAGVSYRNGVNALIRNNNITSNSMTIATIGVNISAGTNPAAVTYTNEVSSNTINLTETGTTVAVTGVTFGYGLSTGTIIGSSNNITLNQTVSAASASTFSGIIAAFAAATNTVNGNTITINQTTSGAGTTSTTLTGISVAGAATTINALNNGITVNQTTSSSSAVTSPINGIVATGAATTLNVGSAGNGNTITIKQAVTGSGSYGSGAITYINANAIHATANIVGNTLNTTGSTVRSTGALIGVFQDATVTALVNVRSNSMIVDRVAASGSIIFQSTSGTPSEVADSLVNNTITFTSLAGTTSATGISSLGGPSSPALGNKNINSNTINISGTNSGTVIGITCAFTNTGFIKNNAVTISCAAPTVTGITTSGTAMTVTTNSLSLATSTTSPTAMTGIAVSGVGTTNMNNNTISSMSFSGVGGTGPTVLGISYTGASTNTVNINNNAISGIAVGAAGSGGSPTIAAISAAGSILTINKNTICSVSTLFNGASTIVSGIRVTSTSGTNTISNNRIGDLNASAAVTTDGIRGINITSTSATSTLNVYNNTVNISSATTAATFGSTGLFHTTSTTGTTATLDLRNNIIVNSSGFAGAGLTVAYRRSGGAAGSLANYAGTSNRNLFYAGTASANNLIYSDGISSAQTIAAYKAGVFTAGTIAPRDANSVTENPPFLSTACGNANFLKINTVVATGAESGGANIAGITDDFEGDVRNATTPDLGADEFTGTPLPLCTGTPAAATITGAAAVCSGLGTTLSLSTTYTDLGITYQWSSGTTPGGPYPTTLGTNSSQATGALTSTTYYQCVITCTNSGLSFTTVEKAVVVNPLPSVSITPASGTYCTPGGTAVALTASGATTYLWSPATGLSATTGTSVNASPSTSQNYTVIGTDGNGCISPVSNTAAIAVTASPQAVTATATPATICSGATSALSATGTIPFTANQYVFAASTGSLDPMTGATTIIGSPAVSSGTGDDTPSSLQTLGFTFYYEGTAYTQYSISPDGWILLGNGTAAAQFSNAVTSTTNVPKIYPLWDDLSTGTNGNVKVLVSGTAPNRIFIAQWLVTNPRVVANAANATYQAWLYEGNNKIEFRYGTAGTSASASAGLTGLAATNFQSITFSSNTSSTVTANNTITTAPAVGTMYSFTPPSSVSFAWTAVTNLVSPSAQNTLTTALTASETFTVTASNGGCSVQAQAAVAVSTGAAITGDPSALARCAGQTAVFTVSATGPGLTYVWRKAGTPLADGGNISGALSNQLTITNVAAADAASYDVVVTATCGSPVTSLPAALTVNALPADVTVLGAGTFCTNTTITASNGSDGTIYFQGTTSNGTSTATPSMSEVVSTSGTYYFRAQSAAGCWGNQGSAAVVIQTPPGITGTPASICANASGTVAAVAANSCVSFVNSGTTYSGVLTAATDPIALRLSAMDNSASCAFELTTTRNYVAQQFQVSVTGNYVFDMTASSLSDNMGYIMKGTFTPGTCPANPADFVRGDDDDGTGNLPRMGATGVGSGTMTLTAGVTYTLITLNYSASTGTASGTFTWTITPPAGGQIMLSNTGNIEWYTLASGGSPVGTGSPFNPVPSVLANTSTPGTTALYAACSNASSCRTAVNFVINANYTVTASSGANGTVTPAGVTTLSCDGTGDQIYTITPDGGYSIQDVLVDGSSVGAVGTYTFTDVIANHTINATFVINCINVGITNIIASNPGPLCSGQTTNLTANGVVGTNALVTWWTGPNGTGTNLGTGTTLNGVGANTYYARVTGDCGPAQEQSVTVNSIGNTFTGTGDWTDNARWSCGAPPSSGDNVTIAAGANATLNTNFIVSGSLTMTATSTLTVNPTRTLSVDVAATANFNGQSVTFKSDATGTASLGQVNGTLSGATNVTVERYIPNNGFRSWRLLSVPTFGSGQTIRQAWQEGTANPLPQQNNLPNYGTQITGLFSTQSAAAAAGFDSITINAGMLTWNGASWSNVTSTNVALANNKSYFLYIRGERSKSVSGAISNSSATTLRNTGTVHTGDQTTNVGAAAFALVPNLYPSAINFTGLTRTGGVNNLFYIWDSKKLSGNSLGVYQTFSGTNSFNCLISGGSYTLGLPNTTIESGQSFFVTSGAAGTIVLKESAKLSGTNGSLGFRPSANPSRIDSRLYNTNNEMLDANVVVFDAAYDRAVDADDAVKYGNPGANFAIETGSKILAIEGTQPVKENDAIQFRMWNLKQQAYRFEFVASNMNTEGLTAKLEDKYLNTTTALDLAATTTVNFTVDANAASSEANRFRIVFAKAKPVVTDTKQGYTIAPNPVENGTMNLQLRNQPQGKYSVRIISNNGQNLQTRIINHAGGTSSQQIELPSGIASGTYQVEIVAPNKTRTVQQLLVD
ncbi:MAG: hypothetical protein IPP72_15370 [Chitinophagaceae bacterium]|nr:hypothetical protein [Chitinophagaceae bacterium]